MDSIRSRGALRITCFLMGRGSPRGRAGRPLLPPPLPRCPAAAAAAAAPDRTRAPARARAREEAARAPARRQARPQVTGRGAASRCPPAGRHADRAELHLHPQPARRGARARARGAAGAAVGLGWSARGRVRARGRAAAIRGSAACPEGLRPRRPPLGPGRGPPTTRACARTRKRHARRRHALAARGASSVHARPDPPPRPLPRRVTDTAASPRTRSL